MVDRLKKLDKFSARKGPVVLAVLDGIGVKESSDGNAVRQAHPENLNSYIKDAKEKGLYAELAAHGTSVGLPSDDDMGNSEVGHNALGAGQIYAQGAKLINESMNSGKFFKTQVWSNLMSSANKNNGTVHFFGLLSDGNIHSHIDQLFQMFDGCFDLQIKKIRVHALLDGRDVPPTSALDFIERLEEKLGDLKNKGVDAQIASGGGRMHMTMDRYYSDWKVVERGWNAHVHGVVAEDEINGDYIGYYTNAKDAIVKARECWPDKKDQFNPPFVIVDNSNDPVGKIIDGDVVINFNFRGDRAIEISEAFEQKDFKGFDRGIVPDVEYAGILEYDGDAHLPAQYLVPPPTISNVSSTYLCGEGIKSFAIAETHKYGHVTYFWNGNKSGFINKDLETYVEIPSDSVSLVEKNPEMKAKEVTDRLIEALESESYHYLRVNYANGDMVGHTGNMDACISSIQNLDLNLKRLADKVMEKNGILIITADHGNAEENTDKKGNVCTSHSLNPVPFILMDSNFLGEYKVVLDDIDQPGIANVMATTMNLLGFNAPSFYEKSLIQFK